MAERPPAAPSPSYCGWCGIGREDHPVGPCAAQRQLDPHPFCETCGRRLDIQIFPDGYRATCRRCRRGA